MHMCMCIDMCLRVRTHTYIFKKLVGQIVSTRLYIKEYKTKKKEVPEMVSQTCY